MRDLHTPLFVLHLHHITELLIHRAGHGNFESVGQTRIFDCGRGGVRGIFAFV